MAATKPNFVSAKKSSRKFLAEINWSDEKKKTIEGEKMAWHFRDCFALKLENVAFALGI